MNSKQEFSSLSNGRITSTHNASSSLLKLDQLTDLELELFPYADKFNNDLKNGTLESILLNDETENYAVPSPVENNFDTFHDYVSHDIPSLSPSQQDTELIEVFPVTSSTLLRTNADVTNSDMRKSSILLTAVNDVPEKPITLKREMKTTANDRLSAKNYKVRCLAKKHKLKKKITEKPASIKMSSLGKTAENSFDDISKNDNLIFEQYNDNTELDNKINDTLLDILQVRRGVNPGHSTDYFGSPEKKIEKECFKFITIFPSKPNGKIINLMVKGKSCRSKQPLTESELRMVTKIVNHEINADEHDSGTTYKNIYYDSESDSNIRYEVVYESVSDERLDNQVHNATSRIKKNKLKSGPMVNGENATNVDKEKYVLNSVARTRCGRISRPPRHVIRDYKRLKRLNESNNDVDDENENNGGYADYGMNEDANSSNIIKTTEPQTEILYGPLEPNKRQFSSLSRCPTCNKIYLGYQRMDIHFQKYPEHRNEELLRHLLIRSKKKALEENNSQINATANELLTSPDATKTLSSRNNGVLKRKGRLYRKLRMRGSKNGSHHLKELLSSYRVEDIVRYAAPVVATVLNSWEYLLLR